MMTPLEEAVDYLHRERLSLVAFTDELAAKRAAFDAENAALIKKVRDGKGFVEAADRAVRALAGAHYAATKEVKPTPGVEIKLRKQYLYDEAVALAWAKEKRLALVPESLDVKAFEKIAKATPLDFVIVEEEPSVQIATDLAKVFPLPAAVASDGVDAGFTPPF